MKNRGNLFVVELNGARFFIRQMAVGITDFLSSRNVLDDQLRMFGISRSARSPMSSP